MLDRTQPPAFQTIRHVAMPVARAYTLDNGLPLLLINAGEQPVVRLEVIFRAGAWHETVPGAAQFAIRMLNEGTLRRTAAQLSEAFDQYGAFTEFSPGNDRSSLTVYCLARHLPALLPVLHEVLHEPAFPENELETQKSIARQTLKVNLEKTAFVATQRFKARVFGPSHPYGRSQQDEVIAALSRDVIVGFYEKHLSGQPFTIFLSGRVSEAEVKLLNEAFGKENRVIQTPIPPAHPVRVTNHTPELVERPDSVQSSVRVGKRLFNRRHPDYFRFLVLNEVLGGYFGSRLMKNIREDKGFTYGIHSSHTSLAHEGYFAIGTDVKKENTVQTLDEIRKEIEILQTELVPTDELETVRNYMLGAFVGSLNTPFEIADRLKTIYFDDLPADFYETYVEHLRDVTASDVLETARQYLALDSLQEVVVGGK